MPLEQLARFQEAAHRAAHQRQVVLGGQLQLGFGIVEQVLLHLARGLLGFPVAAQVEQRAAHDLERAGAGFGPQPPLRPEQRAADLERAGGVAAGGVDLGRAERGVGGQRFLAFGPGGALHAAEVLQRARGIAQDPAVLRAQQPEPRVLFQHRARDAREQRVELAVAALLEKARAVLREPRLEQRGRRDEAPLLQPRGGIGLEELPAERLEQPLANLGRQRLARALQQELAEQRVQAHFGDAALGRGGQQIAARQGAQDLAAIGGLPGHARQLLVEGLERGDAHQERLLAVRQHPKQLGLVELAEPARPAPQLLQRRLHGVAFVREAHPLRDPAQPRRPALGAAQQQLGVLGADVELESLAIQLVHFVAHELEIGVPELQQLPPRAPQRDRQRRLVAGAHDQVEVRREAVDHRGEELGHEVAALQ